MDEISWETVLQVPYWDKKKYEWADSKFQYTYLLFEYSLLEGLLVSLSPRSWPRLELPIPATPPCILFIPLLTGMPPEFMENWLLMPPPYICWLSMTDPIIPPPLAAAAPGFWNRVGRATFSGCCGGSLNNTWNRFIYILTQFYFRDKLNIWD